jgi:hypothetical protein
MVSIAWIRLIAACLKMWRQASLPAVEGGILPPGKTVGMMECSNCPCFFPVAMQFRRAGSPGSTSAKMADATVFRQAQETDPCGRIRGKMVGAVRFELTTSCTRNKRASRATLRPEPRAASLPSNIPHCKLFPDSIGIFYPIIGVATPKHERTNLPRDKSPARSYSGKADGCARVPFVVNQFSLFGGETAGSSPPTPPPTPDARSGRVSG